MTKNQIQNILEQVDNKTAKWIHQNKSLLMSLNSEEIALILSSRVENTVEMRYKDLLEQMTWKEKLEFLKLNVAQLKTANKRRLRQMALLNVAIETAPKILVTILVLL